MKRSRSVLLAVAATFLVSCSSGGDDGPPAVAAPEFSPAPPYDFGAPLAVALATATEGAAIHYTTDGSAPTSASATYAEPITLTATTMIQAFATHDGMADSAVASATYVHRPVSLVLDAGDASSGVAATDKEFLVLNRFTPDPGAFPFLLRTISVRFQGGGGPGTPIALVVLADDDGDPANGATLLLAHRTTLLEQSAWSVYALPEPVLLDGPGDVLVGAIAPPMTFVGLDVTSPAGRSWIGRWTTVEAPDPLSFPPDADFIPIDQVVAGNWMIRASN